MKITLNPINLQNLYITQKFSDLAAGDVLVHYPVLPTGAPDPLRVPIFTGACTLQSSQGPMQISFPLPNVTNLTEAVEAFIPELTKALNEAESQQTRNRILSAGGVAPSQARKLP